MYEIILQLGALSVTVGSERSQTDNRVEEQRSSVQSSLDLVI